MQELCGIDAVGQRVQTYPSHMHGNLATFRQQESLIHNSELLHVFKPIDSRWAISEPLSIRTIDDVSRVIGRVGASERVTSTLISTYTGVMIESAIALVALIAAAIWIYNQLVKDRNQVSAAWSDIDVQLKRRHELVPRLVSCVKAYADYEKATLTAVTELRKQSISTPQLPKKAAIEDAMAAGLHQLVVLAEDYPDLQADENFRQLQAELTDTEDQIQYSRRFYNGAVKQFNTRIQSFPHLLIARPLGFKTAEFFEIEDAGERHTPVVELS